MKLIKDKIKKIEVAEKTIDKLKAISVTATASHLQPAVCYINGGTSNGAVAIDADLFEVTIKSQIERLENSIREDKGIIASFESLLSIKSPCDAEK
jgi:hypothetical protein